MVDTRSHTNRTHEDTIKSLFNDGLSVQEVHHLVSPVATEIDGPATHNGHMNDDDGFRSTKRSQTDY